MKLFLASILFLIVCKIAVGQHKYFSIATFNTQTAYPFKKLGGLFSEVYHPGLEFTLGKNLADRKNHDWFWDGRAAYFFHRYVQHGISLYSNIGYRYKFNSRISSDISLGGGYLQSIPATAKFKLDEDGNYKNNKGLGRAQAIAALGVGAGYRLRPSSKRPVSLFLSWQQRLQLPFVKSYVPLLPYNSMMVGVSLPLKAK